MSIELLDELDPLAPLRNGLRRMAIERDDFSGCPLPIEGERLVSEPSYKYQGLDKIGTGEEAEEGEPVEIRNVFWSHRRGCRVAIAKDSKGYFWAPLAGSANHATALLRTLSASDAWGLEQEATATTTLGTLLRHRQFKQYLLTGMFLETSKRSGVTYLFRKLRPTVALRGNRVLCTMCLHPIGYYEESWAGCMCPTDDVIAHLTLMRGDEHLFWRRSNQHAAHDPAGGLG